jgi:hypothetical protein
MNISSKFISSLLITASIGFVSNDRSQAEPATKGLTAIPLHILLQKPSAVSAQGREILLQTRNAPTGQKYLLVQGGLHGDEKGAQQFVVWLAEKYGRGDSLLNQLEKKGVLIDFLPYSNPDGIYEHQRSNHAGVNLNRNFGVLWGVSRENPGKTKFSEPETSAIKGLFRKRKYIAAVDVHGYVNWVVSPSDPKMVGQDKSIRNAKRYLDWTRALALEVKALPDYELKTAGQLGDGGAFEDWAFWDQQSYAFCLELKTAERYSTGNSIGESTQSSRIDTFIDYEKFIFKMFRHALEIENQIELAIPATITQEGDS